MDTALLPISRIEIISACVESLENKLNLDTVDVDFTIKENNMEAVNHPQHYNQGKYECLDVMKETFGIEATKNFCQLNAFKYVWRAKNKNGKQDIEKAIFYLNYLLKCENE